ncbi:MAG: response regulator [Candidatus Margulisbacteria bacterium]|nr:response regulator [Candidatus Margulisiibacteriota bacterium]
MTKKQKIMVVDDEKEVQDVLQTRFEALGYDVVIAENGEEALEKVKTDKPDLIILDIKMPKLDGYGVCRNLKGDKDFKDTPIVMLSVKAMEKDREIGLKCGAEAYITKPFDPKKLVDTVKSLLSGNHP